MFSSFPWSRGRRDRRQVRRDRGEVEEERVARLLDEPDGLVRQHVGRVVRRPVPVVLEVAVVVDRVVVVRLHRDAVHHLPVVPAGWDRVIDEPVRVGVDVLADERGLVAGVVHPDREVVRLVRGPEGGVAVRPEVVGDAGVVRVLAGEDARPRRPAHRSRHVRVGERDAVVGEQRLDVLHHAVPSERSSSLRITTTFSRWSVRACDRCAGLAAEAPTAPKTSSNAAVTQIHTTLRTNGANSATC